MADGLYFVGVDLVGDKILESNVFATRGIANINELYGIDVADPAARVHAGVACPCSWSQS